MNTPKSRKSSIQITALKFFKTCWTFLEQRIAELSFCAFTTIRNQACRIFCKRRSCCNLACGSPLLPCLDVSVPGHSTLIGGFLARDFMFSRTKLSNAVVNSVLRKMLIVVSPICLWFYGLFVSYNFGFTSIFTGILSLSLAIVFWLFICLSMHLLVYLFA